MAGRNINKLRYADDTTLVCCSPWGCEESDVTEQLNWIGLHRYLKSTYQWHLLRVVQSLSGVWLFCYPMDCSPPGSSVHGISKATILEWIAISFSRESFWLSDWTCVSCMGRQILDQLSYKGSPRILEWVADPFFCGSSQPRNWTGFSCIAGGFFTNWAIRKANTIPLVMLSLLNHFSCIRLFATPWTV